MVWATTCGRQPQACRAFTINNDLDLLLAGLGRGANRVEALDLTQGAHHIARQRHQLFGGFTGQAHAESAGTALVVLEAETGLADDDLRQVLLDFLHQVAWFHRQLFTRLAA